MPRRARGWEHASNLSSLSSFGLEEYNLSHSENVKAVILRCNGAFEAHMSAYLQNGGGGVTLTTINLAREIVEHLGRYEGALDSLTVVLPHGISEALFPLQIKRMVNFWDAAEILWLTGNQDLRIVAGKRKKGRR